MKRALAAIIAAMLIAACGGNGQHQAATGSVHPAGWGKPVPGYAPAPSFGLAPQAVMWDSVTQSAIPNPPFAVAGYTSGRYANYLTFRRAWPKAHTISIAVTASVHADCLDIEPGDATPSQAASWYFADKHAGFRKPCEYSSLWEYINEVRPVLAAAHIARSAIFEWDADYRGCNGTIDTGFDATQCTDKALGRNLDESVVTRAFLTIAQPPYVTPKPLPPLPVCIHKRETKAACAAAKTRIAHDQRAAASSKRALQATNSVLQGHGCRKPYRRTVCRTEGARARLFAQRVRYFDRRAAALQAAN